MSFSLSSTATATVEKHTLDRNKSASTINLTDTKMVFEKLKSKTLLWQQLLAIQYKNIVLWKRNWIWLVSMTVIITVALLGIFISNLSTDNAKLATTKVNKLVNLQVLFAAGTSREAPEIKRLIGIFKQNVERDHGEFKELELVDFNNGK
jgi:hypothetical protein